MTTAEFQSQYHAFRTSDRAAAVRTMREIDCEERVVVVQIGGEYCLMLHRSVNALRALRIEHHVEAMQL